MHPLVNFVFMCVTHSVPAQLSFGHCPVGFRNRYIIVCHITGQPGAAVSMVFMPLDLEMSCRSGTSQMVWQLLLFLMLF